MRCESFGVIHDPEIDDQKTPVFTEKWHNAEPFSLMSLRNLGDASYPKFCTSCEIAIPPLKTLTGGIEEIIICHKERYPYSLKDKNGKKKGLTWTGPQQLGRKFYHASRKCVLERHPYFYKKLITIDDTATLYFAKDHYDYIFDEFHVRRS